MAKLYSNENFSHLVVKELRRLGHDVLTSYEAGQADQSIPDDEVLNYAGKQQRVLLTFNRRHFIRLHNQDPNHDGVVVCTEDRDTAALATRIHHEISRCASLQGMLIRVIRLSAN